MKEEQLYELDVLTLDLNFDLAILNCAIKYGENLEVLELNNFVERIYENSEKIRNIFDD